MIDISRVCRQARATLKEPSRPVTPASLDARLDLIPGSSSYLHGSRRALSRANSEGSRGSKVDNFLYSNMVNNKSSVDGGYAKLKSQATSGAKSNSFLYDDNNYEADNGDISFYDDSQPILNNATSGLGDVGLLSMDLEDNISVMETELRHLEVKPKVMTQHLENMTTAIDKFTKYLKASKFGHHKDLYGKLVESLAKILDATQVKPLRQLTCRHLLKLILVKFPVRQVHSQDARILLRTTRDLYLCASDNDDENFQNNEVGNMVSSSLESDIMVQGGIDQLLEFLSIVWIQVETIFKSKEGFQSDVDHSYVPLQEGEKLYGDVGAFKMFLEAGVYAAGIIRIYSTKETNRRRLCHIGAVSGLSDGLRIVLQVVANAKKENEALQKEVAQGNKSVLLANAAAKRDEAIALSQLGYIVVQMTSTIRNFSLESNGRQQLLTNSTVVAVCYLLNSFQNNAELLLNCVRVTAKLSQFEPFRAQLNRKPKYVSFLAKVIINEGEMCKRVMDGDTSVSWPSWYTWPLLSRTAFTLGNLTTNNDSNRLLIANSCKCLMPLIILLQTCSCSLMHLFASANAGESTDDDGSNVGSSDDDRNDFENETEPPTENKNKGYIPTSFESADHENDQEDDGCAEADLNDATVKLLRLFANLTINETIGFTLAKRKDTTKMLLELLACSDSGNAGREELHLNVVAACTNLTFYSCRLELCPQPQSPRPSDSTSPSLHHHTVQDLQSLATRLSNCLFHSNKEVVLESARALGNLTRNEQVIECLCSNRAAEALVLLLDHSDFDILIAVTGALVNISANRDSLICLSDSHQPAHSLSQIMRKSSFKHLELSTLVCQVFHNLLLHEKEGFDEVVRSALGNTLFELVDTAEDLLSEEEEEYEEDVGDSCNKMTTDCADGNGETEGGTSSGHENKQRYEQFAKVGRMVLDFLSQY